MSAVDFVTETFDEMKNEDLLKVCGGVAAGIGLIAALPIFGAIGTVTTGGAILGSILGAGAGMAVVAEDEEKRKSICHNVVNRHEKEWEVSVSARRGLVEASKSMEGYLQCIKLIYALAATSELQNSESEAGEITPVKEKLDNIFALWLPNNMQEELKLLFQNAPTFYDVGLMIREAFRQGAIDGLKFMDSAERILNHLNSIDAIQLENIIDEWNAFKVGLITDTSSVE